MLTTEHYLAIPGHPAPKGSLKCVGRGGHHQLVEDNKRTKDWRHTVKLWAKRSWPADVVKGQPVGVELTFTMPRPAGHYGTGKNKGLVKASCVDAVPVTRSSGDLDKLVRLVLDALQDAGALVDDAQVLEVAARKAYTQPTQVDDVLPYPGVVIRLYPLEEQP